MAPFDGYEDRYEQVIERAIAFSGQEHAFFLEAKARRLLELAHRHLGDPAGLRVLDVGCGPGLLDRFLDDFAGLHGTDISEAMVEKAARANPKVGYRLSTEARLAFEDGTFDLSFAVCVLHHVPPDRQGRLLGEMRRVTRPGGLVAVFEHNPLNPLTRLVVSRCEFDEEASLLGLRATRTLLSAAGLKPLEAGYILFFPWRGALFERLGDLLSPLPLGAQYYVVGSAPAGA